MHGDIGNKFCWLLPQSRNTNWTRISWDTNWAWIIPPLDALYRPLQVYHRRHHAVAPPLSSAEVPSDSPPVPPISLTLTLSSTDCLPIALRKGNRSTRNSHPIYNFWATIDYLHLILPLSLLYPLFFFLRALVRHFLILGGDRQWLMKWLLCTPMTHGILFLYLLVNL